MFRAFVRKIHIYSFLGSCWYCVKKTGPSVHGLFGWSLCSTRWFSWMRWRLTCLAEPFNAIWFLCKGEIVGSTQRIQFLGLFVDTVFEKLGLSVGDNGNFGGYGSQDLQTGKVPKSNCKNINCSHVFCCEGSTGFQNLCPIIYWCCQSVTGVWSPNRVIDGEKTMPQRLTVSASQSSVLDDAPFISTQTSRLLFLRRYGSRVLTGSGYGWSGLVNLLLHHDIWYITWLCTSGRFRSSNSVVWSYQVEHLKETPNKAWFSN